MNAFTFLALKNALRDNTEARIENTAAVHRLSEALEEATLVLATQKPKTQPHAVPTFIQSSRGVKMNTPMTTGASYTQIESD